MLSGGNASAIYDLVVGGIAYDVVFLDYSGPDALLDTFTGDQTDAETAVNEIDGALNGASAQDVAIQGSPSFSEY